MSLTLATRLQTGPDVIVTELTDSDGSPQAVLLNLATHKYFSLNETGIHIWKALEQGSSLSCAMTVLTDRYEVSPERAAESVLRLAAELAAAGLAIPLEETAQVP